MERPPEGKHMTEHPCPDVCRFAPGSRERLEAEIVAEEAAGRVNTAAVLRDHLAKTYPTPKLVDPDAD